MKPTSSDFAAESVEGPLILSIDIGTSAVKILIFDRRGRAVENKHWRGAFEVRTSKDGASEVDPDAVLEVVWQGIDAVLAKAGPLAKKISGVAACTFVGNIMGLDRNGKPLTPVFTYADTRAQADVARLQAEFNESEVHDRTGCHFHSSYLPARFRWLSRTQPHLIERAERWLSLGEYMDLKLFGQASVSYSVASWSGMLDRHKLVWDHRLLQKMPIDASQLSPLVDFEFSRRGLRPEFAARWPTLVRRPWFPAIGDGAAANIGSGCISPSRAALTMGTTTAIRAVVTQKVEQLPPGLWCYRVDARRSLPGGALSEGGSLFAWMKNILRIDDEIRLKAALEAVLPDGHGLTILPFLSGERSPGWKGHARGTIHGLSLATTPEEILRAGMESVACRIALVFERLSKLLPDQVEVVAGGGALQGSPVWSQIICDVMNRPIAVADVGEATARGAALLAFEALGVIDDLKDIPVAIEHTCRPDSGRHQIYQKALERQKRLYQKLVEDGKDCLTD
jgi:gluconokinase